jgi:GT2 family glycosyltransferase
MNTHHQARVSINIVSWNSMEFLPDLLETIMRQTFRDFNVLVIDNGSNDGVETFLREEYPEVVFLRNPRNLGFSAAHNQGIRYALDHWDPAFRDQQYVLVCNPDILMSDTFLEELVRGADADPQAGSIGGKLLRAFGENLADEILKETVRSDLIDSMGLNPHKNRTVSDMGAGEKDEGQYDALKEVFGISGACTLFRARALEDVRFEDEFFDHDFFAYKEDVDLAWRLRHTGWSARIIPKAVAYHYRGMYGKETSGLLAKMGNRRKKSSQRNYYSTRNHWLMLLKNLRLVNALFSFPWLAFHESLRLLYILFIEPSSLRSVKDVMILAPRMFIKRRVVMKNLRVNSKEMRKWFV